MFFATSRRRSAFWSARSATALHPTLPIQRKPTPVANNNDPINVPPSSPAAGQAPVGGPGAHDGRNRALIIVGALAAIVLVGGLVALFGRSDDKSIESVDSAPIVTEETTTTINETTTTISDTTTTAETTTVPDTSTTVPETTIVSETSVPPATEASTTTPGALPPVVTVPAAPASTMWDVIVNSPDLSEFKAAVEAAGLVDLLDGPDAVTIFVPSNKAFADFRAGIGNEAALADLPALIRHHLVNGSLTSAEVLAVTSLDSLAGNAIAVDQAAGTVDGASLVVSDVFHAGSALHVVDRVLVPAA